MVAEDGVAGLQRRQITKSDVFFWFLFPAGKSCLDGYRAGCVGCPRSGVGRLGVSRIERARGVWSRLYIANYLYEYSHRLDDNCMTEDPSMLVSPQLVAENPECGEG